MLLLHRQIEVFGHGLCLALALLQDSTKTVFIEITLI